MRIQIWSALYLPHTGGVENFTYHAARALADRGHEVQVVTSRIDESPAHEHSEGFDVWRLPCRALMGARLPLPQKNAAYRRLVGEIDAFGAEAVLANARFYGHTLEALRSAQRQDAKAAVLDHGSAHLVLGNALADKVVAGYEHRITNRVKAFDPAFYGISQKSVEWLGHFGIQAAGVINNAIDAEAFTGAASQRNFRAELGIAPHELLVAFCGRMVPEKGPDTLLQAAKLVSESEAASKAAGSGAPLRFVFAGDGALRAPLAQEAASITAGGAPVAHFVGNLNPHDLAALLAQSNLFCLPTRSEGFCTSLLEASAAGVPAIIPDVGGARELIPNSDYGFIVPDRSAETIAQALRNAACLGESGLRQTGSNAQAWVNQHSSWQATAQAIERAFA